MKKDLTEIKNYLLVNDEERRHVINEINCFKGSLQWLDFYYNDEDTINELFSSPAEALRSAYFGNYDYNQPYFRFNGYGNIETLDEYELRKEEKEYINDIINELLDCWGMLDISEELSEMLKQITEMGEE